jgi:hypothetical protein
MNHSINLTINSFTFQFEHGWIHYNSIHKLKNYNPIITFAKQYIVTLVHFYQIYTTMKHIITLVFQQNNLLNKLIFLAWKFEQFIFHHILINIKKTYEICMKFIHEFMNNHFILNLPYLKHKRKITIYMDGLLKRLSMRCPLVCNFYYPCWKEVFTWPQSLAKLIREFMW